MMFAGYVFWGGREGYSTLWNTNMKRELEHLARFLHLAVDYKKKIGFKGQFYIEPKPKEPTKHQYDSDAAACLNFLREYGLMGDLKLNLETNHATLAGHSMQHELEVAGSEGALGSLLLVEKLVKEYPRQGATATLSKLFSRKPPVELEQFRAVDGISFSVGHGESVGLVGESGCGKSTTSMMVMRLLDQTSGRIMFDGDEIGAILPNAFARLPLRKNIQMVFQDPTDSLNPRFTAARAIADPIMQLGDVKGRDALRARCEELAGLVDLPVNLLSLTPRGWAEKDARAFAAGASAY